MKKISRSEYIIMDELWKDPTPRNRHDIALMISQLDNHEPWGLPTISTFISRLCAKGVLTYKKIDRMYCYYPKVSRKDYEQNIINQHLKDDYEIDFEDLILKYTGNVNHPELKEEIRSFLETIASNN